MRPLAIFTALAGLALSALPAVAHHDTEAMIAHLTERIETGEASANLYYQRATEYRVLLRPVEAEADIHRALEQDTAHAAARMELARLLGARGEFDAAIAQADTAVENAKSSPDRATALLLMARLLAAADRPADALAACDAAFTLRPEGDVEWFLLRADLLRETGRGPERPAALQAGFASTHSIVLRNAWIDALLDNGDTATALPVIEEELATSRLKSTWLLRRARARLLCQQRDLAMRDLHACLGELTGRIHPIRPDLTLIADRGLAHALLGDFAAARADLARARAAGGDRWSTAALERELAGDGR